MAIAIERSDPLARPDREDSRLTTQEQRILALAASGWSTSAVAETLGLAPESVGRSLASTIRRVGARSKVEAVMIAVRNGLIELPTDSGQTGTPIHGHRASAARPVARLLRWGEAEQLDAHEPLSLAVASRRMIELHPERVTDVDGAAT